MSTPGNVIWVIFGGLLICIQYIISGLALCITIIGIPFGIQAIKLAQLSLWPFGKEVVSKEKGTGCIATIMNIFWILTFGLLLALHHLFWAIVFAIIIIGIPFAKQHMKLAGLALVPFGKEVK